MKDKCSPESMRAMQAKDMQPSHTAMQQAKCETSQDAKAKGAATPAHVDGMMSKP